MALSPSLLHRPRRRLDLFGRYESEFEDSTGLVHDAILVCGARTSSEGRKRLAWRISLFHHFPERRHKLIKCGIGCLL